MTIAQWRVINPPDWADKWALSWYSLQGELLLRTEGTNVTGPLQVDVPPIPFVNAQGFFRFEMIDHKIGRKDTREFQEGPAQLVDIAFSDVWDWGFVPAPEPEPEPEPEPGPAPAPGGGGLLEGDFAGWSGFGGLSGKQSAAIIGGGVLIGTMLLVAMTGKR